MIRNRLLAWVRPGYAVAFFCAAATLPLSAQASFPAKQRVAAPEVGLATATATARPATLTARAAVATPATATPAAQRVQVQLSAGRESAPAFAAKVAVASAGVIEQARRSQGFQAPHTAAAVQAQAPAQSAQSVVLRASAAAAVPSSPMQAERLGLRMPDDPLQLDSGVALVVDAKTGEILLGKNDTVVLPIASITKLMTAILIVDSGLDLNQTLTITQDDVDRLRGSGSRLPVGAELTRGQALHLALMSSENRAAHALARTFPGGVPNFVRQMNRKAVELGMHETRFADPTGLSGQNRSSARDLAMLTAAGSHRPLVRELSVSPQYQLALGQRVLTYRNSNMLVRNGEWHINLQKTGFIREAGRTLVLQADVAGRSLIMVLLGATGSQARAADADRLLRWVTVSLFSSGPMPAAAAVVGRSGGGQS